MATKELSILTELSLNAAGFDKDLDKSKRKISDFGQTAKQENKGVAGSFNSMKGALGGAMVALGSLYGVMESGKAVIASSEALSDKYERTIGGLNNGFEVFKNMLANMDFSNFFTNITNAIKLGQEYADFLDTQEDKKRGLNIQEAQSNNELTKLRNSLNSVLLTETQRSVIAKQMKEIIIQNGADQKKWANDNLNSTIENIAATKRLSKVEIERFINYKKGDAQIFEDADKYNKLVEERDTYQRSMSTGNGMYTIVNQDAVNKVKELNIQIALIPKNIKDAAEIQKRLSGEEINKLTGFTIANVEADTKMEEAINAVDKRDDKFNKTIEKTANKLEKANTKTKEFSDSIQILKSRYEAFNAVKQAGDESGYKGGFVKSVLGTPNLAGAEAGGDKSDARLEDIANKNLKYNDAIQRASKGNKDYSQSFNDLSHKLKFFGATSIEAFGAATEAMSAGGDSFTEMAKNGGNAAKQIISQNLAIAASQAIMAVKTIPFPFNIVAAGVSLAAIMAIGNSIKFANGGIVGGSSFSGDKVPALVNSGEMILNAGQQSNLFSLLNSGGGATGGGEVTFKIDGTQLIGVLNNHNRKMNKIR